jgi:Putative prokaryotic signal transducing protein
MNSVSEPSGSTGSGGPGGSGGPPASAAGPVLLVRVYDPVEAEIIIGKLRSAGIDAFARHEALSVVVGLTIDGCGQQDIMVRAEDLEEARAALLVPEEPGAAE